MSSSGTAGARFRRFRHRVAASSVKEPARERLHHDGDKEGQDQISRDRKAEAQSSMRNYGRVLINVEISRIAPLRAARPGYGNHIDDSAEGHYTEECQPT